MPSFLLVVKHAIEARLAAERMTQIERDTATADDAHEAGAKTLAGGTAPGDARRLRGIPAIGQGVSGHIPGTHPEDALDRLDRQRG